MITGRADRLEIVLQSVGITDLDVELIERFRGELPDFIVPVVLPRLARRVSSNPEAYIYLQETIDAWPDQPSLARIIARSGWTDVVWRNMTFGVVALHHAVRRSD